MIPIFDTYPDVLTVAQLGEALQVGRSNAYRIVQSGTIHSVKIGKKYLIPKQSLIGFLGGICYNGEQIMGHGLEVVEKGETV